MRKDHGVKSMIKELENKYMVNVIDKDKGFYVVELKKCRWWCFFVFLLKKSEKNEKVMSKLLTYS